MNGFNIFQIIEYEFDETSRPLENPLNTQEVHDSPRACQQLFDLIEVLHCAMTKRFLMSVSSSVNRNDSGLHLF